MRILILILSMWVIGCGAPVHQGSVEVEITPPLTISAFAPFRTFSPNAEEAAEPCATLREVEVQLFQGETLILDLGRSPITATSAGTSLPNVPIGTYTVRVAIYSASEAEVYAGQNDVTIFENQTATVAIDLAETGGCPRPNPEAPTIHAHPALSSCSALRLTGTKLAGSIVKSTAGVQFPDNASEETQWSVDIPLANESTSQGFAVYSAWADDEDTESTEKPVINTSYAGDSSQGEPLFCFNPYLGTSGDLVDDGTNLTLEWDIRANNVKYNYLGAVWFSYEGEVEQHVTYDGTNFDIPDNATKLTDILAPTVADTSVSIPAANRTTETTLQGYSIIEIIDAQGNKTLARNSGAYQLIRE